MTESQQELWADSCELFHPGVLGPGRTRCGSDPCARYLVKVVGRPKDSPAFAPMLLCDGHAEELGAEEMTDSMLHAFGWPSEADERFVNQAPEKGKVA